MSKVKLIITTLVIGIIICAATIAVLYYVNKPAETSDPDMTPPTSERDPAKLQQEAESLIISDPEEASEKYEEASEIYEDSGEIDKAAENAANAAAAEASTLNSAPPTAPSTTGGNNPR